MDYFESVWNERINECVHQIELCMSVAAGTMPGFTGELNSLRTMCNQVRHIPDRYTDLDRIDLDIIADKLRDAVVSDVAKIIRMLQYAKDEISHDIMQLQDVINGVG